MQTLSAATGINNTSEIEFIQSYSMRYNTKKNKIFMHKLQLPLDIRTEIFDSFKLGLNKTINDYDIESQDPDFISNLSGNLLIHHDPIKNTFFNDSRNINTQEEPLISLENEKELPLSDKIDFLLLHVKIKKNNKSVLLFLKQKSDSILKKRFFRKKGNEFDILDNENLYIFDTSVSCILYEDTYYIYHIGQFNQIFKYWDALEKKSKEVQDFLEKEEIVSNLDKFKETFGKHYNLKSITKINPKEVKPFLEKNKDDIKKACEERQLHLQFDDSILQFTVDDDKGVTILNRILSKRSGYSLEGFFITFPTYEKHANKNRT
jgi:Domain of unknown function (DUF4868)